MAREMPASITTKIVKAGPKKPRRLVIEIPIEDELQPSSTGKTLIVGSTRGNVETTVTINGKPVIMGLNAYVYRDRN
jgi:hypothetical protein